MAQKLFEDKIPTLTNAGNTVTMPAGARLTIGGQQFVTTSGLSVTADISNPNTRYQIYAVQTAGVVSLVVSSNENSQGPASATAWKLVGSYYTNGLTTVGFGSFVTITGRPSTKAVFYKLEETGFGAFEATLTWQRSGQNIQVRASLTAAGATSPGFVWKLPENLVVDTNDRNNNGGFKQVGYASYDPQNGNIPVGACLVVSNASRDVQTYSTGQVAGYGSAWGGNQPNNASWALNHEYEADLDYRVIGWDETPIEDL